MGTIMLLGLLSGAVDLKGLAARLHESEEKICHAFFRLTIDDDRPIPTLKQCQAMDVVRGDDCKTNYTVYQKGSKQICQCNDGSKHSEQLAIKDGAKDMLNLHNPCYYQCYPFIIRYLISHRTVTMRISYKSVKDADGIDIHDALKDDCKPYAK